jgi:glutathione peroxidase
VILTALVTLAAIGCNNAPMDLAIDAPKNPTSIYDFTMKNIDGKAVPLNAYKGKVLLVVNVASKCGFTPQYAGLQKLYTEYHKKGFEILGFPANNFGAQEPGTDPEIKTFCSNTYGVSFPMFSKISVKGTDEHPLYKWLIASADRHDDIEWNFCKFLVDKNGHVIKRWASKTTPDSAELTSALDSALKS